jgi:exopolysaccharide biosynthesis polyprenyl glycosylphosphotransferase
MLRRKERLFAQLMFLCDLAALVASYIAAYWIRTTMATMDYPARRALGSIQDNLALLAIAIPASCLALHRVGLYQSRNYESPRAVAVSVVKAQIAAGLVVLSAMYLGKREDVSRLFVQIFIALGTLALIAGKLAARTLLIRRVERSRARKRWRVAVVGDDAGAARYMRLLREHPFWAIEVAAVIPPIVSWQMRRVAGDGFPIQSQQTQWSEALNGHVIDEVVAVASWEDAPGFAGLAEACRYRGLIFRMLIDMPESPIGTYNIDDLGGGSYLVSLETVPQDLVPLMAKRAIDILGAIVGLSICALIYPWYAWRLKRESPGPVIFRQQRIGRNGREFTLYKFRTMHVDAESKLPMLARRNQMNGPIFKIKNDPRITPTGAFMRRTHLDEFPQFWNVLKGDMSLVGTRPPTTCEVERYDSHHYRRLSFRPGITGLWQLAGNAAVNSFDDVVTLDCRYIDRWSLWGDCKLLLRTIHRVIRAQGW